jgi:putative toxin-antitoxin system antitoxin component (TIGR02293 family)
VHIEIMSGLPGAALKAAKALLGINNAQLAKMLGLKNARTTSNRLSARHLSAVESDRVYRLLRAYGIALQAFDSDREEAADWFTRPSDHLSC